MKHEALAPDQLMAAVAQSREAYARQVYDIERVRRLMWQEAEAGEEMIQLVQEKKQRLQGTRAAMKLIAWLARCHCRIDWIEMQGADERGRLRHYAELCIYWSGNFNMLSVPAEQWLANGARVVAGAGSKRMPGE